MIVNKNVDLPVTSAVSRGRVRFVVMKYLATL